jgi:transposase
VPKTPLSERPWPCDTRGMFLRRHRRHASGETYEYWSLVKTVRTARGPRQQVVARLGKLEGAEVAIARGWQDLDALLEGRPPPTQLQLGGTAEPKRADWQQVNLQGLRVERVRQFGRVYLGLALWRRLGLHTLLAPLLPAGQEDIGWDQMACVLTLGRFCAQPSELSLAERWYDDTALADLLGVPWEKINEARLYRGLDELRPHKEALCRQLLAKYRDWFGVRFEFLLYDITSTYFEGLAERNELAARGYSRDHRPDCKQVCIGLVVTPEGLPVGYEVFAGNRADVTTVEAIVTAMEEKYGQAERVWVLDRGMVSEENLEFLRARKAHYLVGTPKAQLRRYQQALLEKENWQQVEPGIEVKLLAHPDGRGQECFVLCRSSARQQKEKAMLELQRQRLGEKLAQIDAALRKRPADADRTERRIGRWLGRYPGAEHLVEVSVGRNSAGQATGLQLTQRSEPTAWAQQAQGAYLLRTNYPERDPRKLWKWYLQLQQAEAAFRTSKSDLGLRPIFHQKTERVEAHILISFLSLALWRALEQWMHAKGLGDCARQLLHELDELRSMDVVLPVKDAAEIRLRVVCRPEKPLAELLAHLGLELPRLPKKIENVVPKIDPQKAQDTDNQDPSFSN